MVVIAVLAGSAYPRYLGYLCAGFPARLRGLLLVVLVLLWLVACDKGSCSAGLGCRARAGVCLGGCAGSVVITTSSCRAVVIDAVAEAQ